MQTYVLYNEIRTRSEEIDIRMAHGVKKTIKSGAAVRLPCMMAHEGARSHMAISVKKNKRRGGV